MTRSEFAALIKKKYLIDSAGDIAKRFEVYDSLFHTGSKIIEYFGSHDCILVSVSGGSDSDCIVHLICTYFPEFIEKCHFVFCNTGLEYEATKRHLIDIEKNYNITIRRIRGRSVVSVIKEYGVPVLSKTRSEDIYYYLRDSQWAIDKIDGNKKYGTRYAYPDNFVSMIHYAKANDIKISNRCCQFSKKNPIKQYIKQYGIDLNVTGERKAEGGQRASSHKSCFEVHKKGDHKYMPLWWWSDNVKAIFKQTEGIRFSDCYEVYGMKRTGCVGCPYNLSVADELQAMFEYEPQLFKACMNVFGVSYYLMDKFHCRRKPCLPDYFQMPLF